MGRAFGGPIEQDAPDPHRGAPVWLTPDGGPGFSAVLRRVDPDRLCLTDLERRLQPRATVVVEVFGHSIQGTVAGLSESRVVIDVVPSAAIFSAIEAFEDFLMGEDPTDDLGVTVGGPDLVEVGADPADEPSGLPVDPRDVVDDEDLPVLRDDGTVRFRSFAQFIDHHEHHLTKGAMLARGASRPLESRHRLLVVVPDAGTVAVSSARVLYCQDGRIGFAVDRDAFSEILVQRFAELRRQSSGRMTTHPVDEAPLIYRSPLVEQPDARALLALPTTGGEAWEPARGWYVGLLDRLMRSEHDAVCEVSRGDERVCIWIRLGHVVAAERWPIPPGDRIGERMVASEVLDVASMRRALVYRSAVGQPLGQCLLQNGITTVPQLHSLLRDQILDRAAVPSAWSDGEFEVRRWSAPPVGAELMAVKRVAVLAHAIRVQAGHMSLDDLKSLLRAHLSKTVRFDENEVPTSGCVPIEERGLLDWGAYGDRSLESWLTYAESRRRGAAGLVLLGLAFGFLRLDGD